MLVNSKIVNKKDFDTDEYKNTCKNLKEKFIYHRKPWEFVMIANAFFERGCLENEKEGLGFGVGTEPLTAYFANKGCKILATDQATTTENAENWKQSNQICNEKELLNSRSICDSKKFNELVTFKNVDMNYIPTDLGEFDFIWSACALEHLGTLQNGLWFIMRTLSLLKSGGYAMHTTEYNLSSNDATNFQHLNCIYRKQDLEVLKQTVIKAGYEMEEIDLTRGTHEYDLYVDKNGWQPTPPEPHLNLKIDGFDATSVLLIFHKPK